MINVYSFKDYSSYLNAILQERDKATRGSRKALAEAMGCQSAYVSHILSGRNHLSLEQADAASRFLNHGEEERHFFLLQVQHDRAGTTALRKYFHRQLEALLSQRELVQTRLRSETQLAPDQQARYYSHWIYPAIHMVLMLKDYQTAEAVARRLKLEIDEVQEAFRFLEHSGLVRFEGEKTVTNLALLHLPASSPLIRPHHTTWRLHAAERIGAGRSDHLHYSGALALSLIDSQKIRSIFLEALERTKTVAQDSHEEDVFALAIDFYPL